MTLRALSYAGLTAAVLCAVPLSGALAGAPSVDAGRARSSASSAPAAAPAACTGKTGQAGTFRLTLESGGYTRTYKLHVPPQYASTDPMPLVINFHGYGSTGESQDTYTGMSAKADQAGFIAIHPDGIENSWNGGSCCGTAASTGVDDVGFARDLIEATAASYCVNLSRVYATGFSNGGYMSHRLACEASDAFAAVAPASGIIGIDGCAPPRAVPVIQSQGTVDPLVTYKNAKKSNDFWAAYDQCGAPINVYRKGVASCIEYTPCASSTTVKWCEVKGMGHDWPTGTFLNATDMFWDFFSKHSLSP